MQTKLALPLLASLLLMGGCPAQEKQAGSEAQEPVTVDPPAVEVEPPQQQQIAESSPDAMPAPDFSFTLASGAQSSLSDYRGKPVVLNFWAEW